MKYSDYFMQSLLELGYSHCFFVAGGNSMHLLESASSRFECIPVTHEVSASIACEYFNEVEDSGRKAFALVTAGPGFTNLVTGLAGAWLDSREVLIVGGQAKSTNLSRGTVRQLGHQEIDGVSISKPISKFSSRIESPWHKSDISMAIKIGFEQRPGPVFLEVCLDVSAMNISESQIKQIGITSISKKQIPLTVKSPEISVLKEKLRNSKRPIIILGGGVKWKHAHSFLNSIKGLKVPVACTWTGADRVGEDYTYFAGRPNSYGMRWANIIQQQSDLLIVVGSSLGFQQTGFNTKAYNPVGEIVHVDIDANELDKEYPRNRIRILSESHEFLKILSQLMFNNLSDLSEWVEFIAQVKSLVPTLENCQISRAPFISPHEVIFEVSKLIDDKDCIVSSSSGGTFTASMQIFSVKNLQRFLGNKGLASMGYGLAGAIGACFARPKSRVVLFEGDGGFVQNFQEIGTVVEQGLNLKIFVTCNDGYASIRTSQKNYFGGHYLGCDKKTGLFLPNWEKLAEAFDIPYMKIDKESINKQPFRKAFKEFGPHFFAVQSDPQQVYLPKLESAIDADGKIVSPPLHEMTPYLEADIAKDVFRYINPPSHP